MRGKKIGRDRLMSRPDYPARELQRAQVIQNVLLLCG